MKKLILFIFIFSIIFAENNAVDFMDGGLSARGLALGHSCTALHGGIDNVFYNPAGLAYYEESINVKSAIANNFDEVERKNLGVSLFDSKNIFSLFEDSVIGINYATSQVNEIYKTEWQDERPEVLSTFSFKKENITLTNSKQHDNYLAYGFNLKMYSYEVDIYAAAGVGMDLGLLYRLPNNIYNMPAVFGATIHNLGRTRIFWSTGHEDSIPMKINLGLSLYRNFLNKKLVLIPELENIEEDKTIFKFGAEYHLVNNVLILRGGLEQEKFSYGLGLYLDDIGIDYGQMKQEDLGLIKRVTISYKF